MDLLLEAVAVLCIVIICIITIKFMELVERQKRHIDVLSKSLARKRKLISDVEYIARVHCREHRQIERISQKILHEAQVDEGMLSLDLNVLQPKKK